MIPLWKILATPLISVYLLMFNSRKGQRTNQKYRNLVGSDQQMQRLEETEPRKADRTVGGNFNIFSLKNFTRFFAPSSVLNKGCCFCLNQGQGLKTLPVPLYTKYITVHPNRTISLSELSIYRSHILVFINI